MDGRPLDEKSRARLLRVLSDDRPEPSRWLERIADWGRLEGRDPFSAALEALFHVGLAESDAAVVLRRILDHRGALAERLGRDPGVRVAGVDFLTNIEPRLTNPVVVDEEDWERTLQSARSDPLTGLYNREVFHATLVREIRRAHRFRTDLSLVLFDLDGFKEVNDRYGHLLGDKVLERVGSLLKRSIRETDLACRYGGEEFGIVLPQTDRLGAFEAAERIRVLVETRFRDEDVEGVRLLLTLSGGIASHPEDGATATEIVARADAALYDAKEAGRNCVRLRHPERRRAVRYPARRDRTVLLEVSGSPPRRAVPLDVSRDGMLVECDAPGPDHGSVELLVGESDSTSGGRPHVLRGTVARSEAGETGRRLGLVFEGPIPESVRAELAAPRRPRDVHRGAA